MKASFLFLCLLIHGAVCGQFEDMDGLMFESPDSTQAKDPNFFNRDNYIYTVGREFTFSYTIIKDGDTLLCRVIKRGDAATRNWTLVAPSQKDSLTIRHISFKVLDGYGGLDQLFPDYSQTVIQQHYYSPTNVLLFDGLTGLVENSRNIWIHPFRGKFFSVTELSPFPYMKMPPKKGRHWGWQLHDIDDRWSDTRIIDYKGKQQATYSYEVTGKSRILTAFGYLDCFKIEATASSGLGETGLIAYFHPEYGFVRLRYDNIDKSIIELNLVKVTGFNRVSPVNVRVSTHP